MDAELKSSTLSKSFMTAAKVAGSAGEGEDDDTQRDEVDDAVNLVASVMESVGSQLGAAGPVSNMLGELSVPVPAAAWRAQQDATKP